MIQPCARIKCLSISKVAEADLANLTFFWQVPDLKKELKARGLSTAGNKNELLERLQGALKSKLSDVTADSVDDLEEDLLNVCIFCVVHCKMFKQIEFQDDDDEHLDTSESVIQELDSAMEVASSVVHKRKAEDKDSIIEHTKGSAPKKIVLNRTPSTSSENNQNGSLNSATVSKLDTDSDKKVIKLSELSSKEVIGFFVFWASSYYILLFLEIRNEG